MKHRIVIAAVALLAAMMPALARSQAASAGATWRVFATIHPSPLFYRASGVAVGGSGNVFIADRGDHRVEKISPAGKVLAAWGTDSAGPLHFSWPRAVAVDVQGHVYVADKGITKLSSSGRFLVHWVTPDLRTASGVAVGRQGTVYAVSLHQVSSSNNLHDQMIVTKVSSTGRVLASWVYRYPEPIDDEVVAAAIAVAPSGNVILSIHGNRFCHSCDGTYYQVWTISPAGKTLATWNAPTGGQSVAVDPAGRIYLAGPNVVDALSLAGTPLGTFGTAGCGPSQLGADLQVAVGPVGQLYVADSQSVAVNTPLRDGVLHAQPPTGTPVLYGQCPASNSRLFGQSSGLAFGPRGNLFLADEGDNRVQRYSSAGALLGSFAAVHPPFVAVDRQGNIYVSDLQRGLLQKLSPSGAVLGTVRSVELEGAAVDVRGYVYGLSGDGTVTVFPPIGSTSPPSAGRPAPPPGIRHWQLHGYARSNGGLNPQSIALDTQGNVYVADTRFSRVQKFSSTGKLLGYWGKPGSGPGQFRSPNGIGVDQQGHVFVLDTGNNRVQELDGRGRVLAVLGREGMAVGQFIRPVGIAVDGHGNVYVGDNGNDRVQELLAGH